MQTAYLRSDETIIMISSDRASTKSAYASSASIVRINYCKWVVGKSHRGHFLTVGCGVERGFNREDRMVLDNTRFIAESVAPDFPHVAPIGGNFVFDLFISVRSRFARTRSIVVHQYKCLRAVH